MSTKSRIRDMCNGMVVLHECNKTLQSAFGESAKNYFEHRYMSHLLNGFEQHQNIKKQLYEFVRSEICHVAWMTDEEIIRYLQNEKVEFVNFVYEGDFVKAFGTWDKIVGIMKNIDESMHNEQFKNDIKLWEWNEYGIQE